LVRERQRENDRDIGSNAAKINHNPKFRKQIPQTDFILLQTEKDRQ
jgi:hypothetical protein